MEQHYRKIVKDTEKRVIAAIQRQIMEPGIRCGGFLMRRELCRQSTQSIRSHP